MGLFDKVKKKENTEVQAQPEVKQEENIQAIGTENVSQPVASEVSIDNNPFVEEVAPVEETNNATENTPSFDNIFNATPGDLIMPENTNIPEGEQAVQPATPALQVPEFEDENKEDTITQIVSETVNPVPAPSVEEPVATTQVENSIPLVETPDLEPLPELADNLESLENELPTITEPIESTPGQPVEAIAESPVVESIEPAVETPVAEAPIVDNAEPVVALIEETPQVEEVQPVAEIQPTENIEAVTESPVVESIETAVETPVAETPIVDNAEPVVAPIEVTPQVEEAQPVEESVVENVEPIVETPVIENIASSVPLVEEPTETIELAPTETEVTPIVEEKEPITETPVVEIPTVENVELQPAEVTQELNNNEENIEITDITADEPFIPEEIVANQNSDIIELTPEPQASDETPLMELSNEPMNYENDIAALAPDEENPESPQVETQEEIPTDENTAEAPETNVEPVIEDIQSQEIVIPELENPVVEEPENTNEDYYNNVEITPVIEPETSNEEIKPIIEEESSDIVLPNEVETSNKFSDQVEETTQEGSEIRPIIEEDEVTLNLGDNEEENSSEEEPPKEENVAVIEEQEETPIVIENQDENPEENPSDEEPSIVLESNQSSENIQTEEENESESTEESPNEEVSTEAPVSEDNTDTAEENKDITAPEFDFQAFMMPQTEETNDPNIENPTVVEAQLDTATYISEPTTTRFCNNCGVMLTDDSSICPSCGEPID